MMRLKLGMAAACVVLAGAACEGSNLFTTFGGGGGPVTGTPGTGTIQGSVVAGAGGQGGVPVILVGRDSTDTDGFGVFVFDSVPAATYQVAVRVPLGFALAAGQTSTRSVTVVDGGTSGVTFILQQTTLVTP